mgnify:CR=1 FL=1
MTASSSTARGVLGWLKLTLEIAVGLLVLGVVFCVTANVFGRYVLNDTPTWIEQSSLLIVVYITCLGAAAGVRFRSHLSIDFLREGAPRPLRLLMQLIADAFVIAFGGVMAWQGWLMMLNNADRPIPMLGLSESWRSAPLVACGVLLVIFTGAELIQRAISTRKGH